MEQGMNLVGIQIKNFLSISDVSITPGRITQIVGANRQGKTSILKAIEVGMKGSNDGSVVKVGETQAEIILEFSDGMSVRRRVKSDGSQDVKVSKNDMEAKAPQGFLNSIFETSAFNPLELLEPKRRAEAILQVVPAKLTEETVTAALEPLPAPLPPTDYTKHGLLVVESLYQYFYARRKEANAAAKKESSRLQVETENLSTDEQPKGSHEDSDLDRMMGECDADIRQLQQKQGEQREKERRSKQLAGVIAGDEQSIRDLEDQLEGAKGSLARRKEEETRLNQEVLDVGPVQPEIDRLTGIKLRHSEEKTKNADHRLWRSQIDNLEGQKKRLEEAEKFAAELDRVVSALSNKVKSDMMESTEMPIPGITFTDGKFFFRGIAIENLSTAESMELACSIARALAKKTKVICLDGAEALDAASYEALKKQIDGDGFTYFVSKVGEPFESSKGDTVVRMENGAALQ